MLDILLSYMINFMYQPTGLQTATDGQYVQVMRVDYNPTYNYTYATVAVYETSGHQVSRVEWMEPMIIQGNATVSQANKFITDLESPYSTVIGLK